MSIPSHLLVHTVTVEPLVAAGAYGDTFGEPFVLRCYVEATTQLTRSADGEEVTSSAQVYADPATPATDAPAGSRIRLDDRTTFVLSVATFDDAGLTGLAHRELMLA